MLKVALSITHADFNLNRQESMARLREQLRLGDIVINSEDGSGEVTVPCFGRIPYHEETGRAPHHVWARRQWAWGAKTGADWVIFLQDDTIAAPDFWQRFEKFVRGEVFSFKWVGSSSVMHSWINLLTHHPGSRAALRRGFEAYATVDGLIGCGYAASAEELRAMQDWEQEQVVPGTLERVSDDVFLSLYCMSEHRPIVTPVIGLIDHDLNVGTLHPTEQIMHRRAYVRWDDESRYAGSALQGCAMLGRFYETAHTMLPGVLLDSLRGVKLAREYELQRCPPEYSRYFELIVAQKEWE